MKPPPILDIQGLCTAFRTRSGDMTAVSEVELAIHPGETVALVGESGSGKSVTSLSIMRLLARKVGFIKAGSILLHRKNNQIVDLATIDEEEMRRIRGFDAAMIFQEPMTSLNPVYTIGDQIAEPLRVHQRLSRKLAFEAALALLDKVGIPDARRRARQYPHELSGGMRQRATIAMALICNPTLLIADEPTTALDVTIQAQILDLMQQLQQTDGMGMLFVTHNLGVVAEIAQHAVVMYAGRIVESGPVKELFHNACHPYTIGLLRSMPRLRHATAMKQRQERLIAIPGQVPGLADLPSGCAFAPRCSSATAACREAMPPLFAVNAHHVSRCIHWQEVAA